MRPLLRLPLRQSRFLHAPAAYFRRAPERTALVLGVSLAVAGYAGWRIAGPDQRIALDALPKQSAQITKPSNSRPEETEPDATFASAPEHPKKKKPMRINDPVEEESARHQDDKSTGYPSDTMPHAVPKNGNTENGPEGGKVEGEEGEGAFDPVTGQINWDCPCLGGMAHGPCGPQFREAFSCFIYSEQEPKGIDCVEKFKNMQDCFREHPDVYGEEIVDDEEDDGSDQLPVANQIATKETSETSPTSDTPSPRPVSKDKRSREYQ